MSNYFGLIPTTAPLDATSHILMKTGTALRIAGVSGVVAGTALIAPADAVGQAPSADGGVSRCVTF
jgi:hypothetical protein